MKIGRIKKVATLKKQLFHLEDAVLTDWKSINNNIVINDNKPQNVKHLSFSYIYSAVFFHLHKLFSGYRREVMAYKLLHSEEEN